MQSKLIEELSNHLNVYQSETRVAGIDSEKMDGIQMIAKTGERLLKALKENDKQKALYETLTFSRQVSDAYYEHPKSLMPVAEAIRKIRNELSHA